MNTKKKKWNEKKAGWGGGVGGLVCLYGDDTICLNG